jgi:hypothetical protein
MIIVYRAANITDAHLIRQMLEAEGITAFIQGEYLQGAIGELPANTEILVRVADGNADAARAIVEAWEKSDPVGFETDDSEPLPLPHAPAASTSAARGVPKSWIAGALVVGGLLGAAATWAALYAPQLPSEIDLDGDGRADEFAYYFGERLERVEQDRNRDGKIDQTTHYGTDGFLARTESDDDFNGRIDGRIRYSAGQIADNDVDFDGDGRPEYRAEYQHGLILREEYMGADGIPVKRVEFRNGWPERDEFDSDGDGRMDTARRYDRNAEIVASEPLSAK